MDILHTVAGLWDTTGGPAASVPDICGALADRGHRVTLLTGAGHLADSVRNVSSRVVVKTVPLGPYWLGNYSVEFGRLCAEEVRRAEVVHTHGVWLHPNWVSGAWAKKSGKLFLISPRGMLEPWALRRSRCRKRLAWHVGGRAFLHSAGLIHATSPEEAKNVRHMGLTSPIAVVPNGVDLDRTFSRIRVAEMRDGVASPPPAVVFIGRIHPKKGLDLLLDAWGECRAIRAGARLLLAGYGERSHVRWLENRLAGSRDDSVEFLGPVTGEKKLEMLVGSLALVLPSLSENYGMVVAEALACGTPVITTTGTPWKVLRDEGCGWWVRPEVEELSGALKELFGMGHQERTRKGEAGRLVVEREHSLVRSAEMIERAYLWALGKGNRPPWIDTCELS